MPPARLSHNSFLSLFGHSLHPSPKYHQHLFSGPHLVPAWRPIDRASFSRCFSDGTLKNAQRPHHHHLGRHFGTSRPMGENTEAPPPFPLTEVDKWVLSQTDEEFKYHEWDELRELIDTNQLHLLKRKPSDLRRYIKWTTETKAEYGNITNFLLAHRLPKAWGEPPFQPVSEIAFADPSDYRVLKNDWPYGFAPGISHIVVWSRTPIATDDTVGDMTPESRKIVADFIQRYFVDRLGPDGKDKVIWFKNWVALQSVRAVDHVHVLVRDVDPAVIEEWTEEQPWHRVEEHK
ncbi:hypothetical protein QBC35DRAFT_491445 [Podospora australis]|uniref:N-acetylglucosamine-induced protein 1 n=1 Tax=Podospora australis TaxID=1536484 RepID=A0AAN6X0Z9_9PEZI|nr:hypothetical protein QBC35DRAFT_491445 [Podospora australis]